jgi:hypothetical protein
LQIDKKKKKERERERKGNYHSKDMSRRQRQFIAETPVVNKHMKRYSFHWQSEKCTFKSQCDPL